MKNELIIVPSSISASTISSLASPATDFFAMTPLAMFSLESAGFPYTVVEDFSPVDAFRKDLLDLNRNAEFMFEKLDILARDLSIFERAFSSNIYWFLCLFGDLLVIGGWGRAMITCCY